MPKHQRLSISHSEILELYRRYRHGLAELTASYGEVSKGLSKVEQRKFWRPYGKVAVLVYDFWEYLIAEQGIDLKKFDKINKEIQVIHTS